MKGTYRYWRDDVLQDIVEPWTWQEGVLRGQRVVGGQVALDVEARYADQLCTHLQLTWQDNRTTAFRQADLPPGTLIFPLLRAGTGALLAELAGGARRVLVPDLHDPSSAHFLQPLITERSAARLGAGHYRYLGGEYGSTGCECWLRPDGLLDRYRWESPAGTWESRLD